MLVASSVAYILSSVLYVTTLGCTPLPTISDNNALPVSAFPVLTQPSINVLYVTYTPDTPSELQRVPCTSIAIV